MSKGFNQCTFIGNLGVDPESRNLNNGDMVTNFRIGVSETWKDRQGDRQERTEWVTCVAFRRLAEIISEYATKGMRVFVQGKMQTRKWQDREGHDRWTTEIIVDDFQMLDKGSGGGRREQPRGRPDGYGDNGGGYGGYPDRGGGGSSQSNRRPRREPREEPESRPTRRGTSSAEEYRRTRGEGAVRRREPEPPTNDLPFDDDIPF